MKIISRRVPEDVSYINHTFNLYVLVQAIEKGREHSGYEPYHPIWYLTFRYYPVGTTADSLFIPEKRKEEERIEKIRRYSEKWRKRPEKKRNP
ncbi:hypothetical protein [Aeropyrum camini]|uniref:Uncharacterized protein n=1 Tax=Aeropyrum camini SY1 = JCM 12091 TaxID=1198449 RepID=U3TFD9_9CREN|nr:hypothetical protein [Aeropyrum camini]BAN90049.1 hypothetical protein ACAM_0580 [Aeropyrum camini SY1 = JCM 12091]